MTTTLKRLAKLRQFQSGGNIDNYLSTEHRQNLLAIEAALDIKPAATESIDTSIPANTTIFVGTEVGNVAVVSFANLNYSSVYDPSNINVTPPVLVIPNDGKFLIEFNFNNLIVSGTFVAIQVIKNGAFLIQDTILYSSDPVNAIIASVKQFFLLDLLANDEINFKIGRGTIGSSTYLGSTLKVTKY